MKKQLVIIATILAVCSVMLGAFGAHILKEIFNVQQMQTFETAVRYQFYHVFAIFLTAIIYKEFKNKKIIYAAYFFILGIFLFSGSLYLLCALQNIKWIGIFTPIGGLCFIFGWILLAWGVAKSY